jgi:hypothetical protein
VAYVEADDTAAARPLIAGFAADGFELPLEPSWLTGLVSVAEAVVVCGERDAAAVLFDKLLPAAGLFAFSDPTVIGPVSHTLGALAASTGRFDVAEQHLGRSAEFCRLAGARFFGARTDLVRGQLSAARGMAGDVDRARSALVDARQTAVDCGYAVVARRASAALDQLPG